MLQMAFLMLFAFMNPNSKELTYESAYAKADKENKPLLVIVGADWCAACKTLKSTTIDRMKEAGDFENVVVAFIDKDHRPDLASKIMQGDSLPQLIVFSKGDDGWKRFSLTGIQSEGRVRELIRRAAAPETASSLIVR
ncbi:MAG: thioredoxin family protein [Pirellulales bacterium]